MGVEKLLSLLLVLLLQTLFSRVECKMVAPSQPIVVTVGSDVTLPCQLDSVRDLRDLVVEWARPDLKPPYVHIRRDGLDLLMDQNSLYQGRSRLTERGLQYGDMSLQLSKARTSDGGTYRCYIPQMDAQAQVTLYVVAVSHVSLTLSKDRSGSAVLCESRGWYPEPELDWLDSEGKNLLDGRTEAISSMDETFSVSRRLSVEQSHGKSFTCRVRQPATNQSREADVIIKDEFLSCPVPSCSVAWTLFTLCLLVFAAALVFVLWKFKFSNRGKKSVIKDTESGEIEEKKSMMEQDTVTSAPKTEESVRSWDLKSSEHKDNLKKIQDDLKFVEEVINKLKETKDFLMELKKKPQHVIEQLNTQITVIKNMKYSWYDVKEDKKKEKNQDVVKVLETQIKECMNTVEEIDKQVITTDTMIFEAGQRKGRLEAEYEMEKRREEAAAPVPQQGFNQRKTNVPVATIQALEQTEESTGVDEEDQDVDELTNGMEQLAVTNKKVFPPSTRHI